jgi:hypothetical protein
MQPLSRFRNMLHLAGATFGLSLALASPLGAQEPTQETLVETKLLADDGVDGDNFGTALAIEGYTLVVAAPEGDLDDPDEIDSSGVVYVFGRDQTDGPWVQQQTLVPARGHYEGNFFEMTLALQGDTLVVGAPNATLDRNQEGAVYVFERDETGHWAQSARITDVSVGYNGHFGISLALDGDLLVVGATQENFNVHGRVGIFERDRGGPDHWGRVTTLYGYSLSDPSNSVDDLIYPGAFGSSVAIEGDLLLVGASSTSVSFGRSDGAAYLFRRSATDPDRWEYLARLVRPGAADCTGGLPLSEFIAQASPEEIEAAETCADQNPITAGQFGNRVAMQGDTVVVSALGAAGDDGSSSAGKVYVYRRDPSGADAWPHAETLSASDPSSSAYFGSDLALAGDTLLVAAPGTTIDSRQNQGAVYAFERDVSGSWDEIEKLIASDGLSFGYFGEAVALDGRRRLIGAKGDHAARGAVYLHEPEPEIEPQACQPSSTPTAELGDDSVITASSGVLLGAAAGTLSGTVPVWINEVGAPEEPLFENALPVGAYYNIGAGCTTFAPHGSPFGVALPVPDQADTTHLAAAVLSPAMFVSDGPSSGQLWEPVRGVYDADNSLYEFPIYGLPSEGITLVLVEHPDLGPLDVPVPSSALPARAGAYGDGGDDQLLFLVTCMNEAATNPGCDQEQVQIEMLEASVTYREQGFPDDYLQDYYARFDVGVHSYRKSFKQVLIWPSSDPKCHPGSRYHHQTDALSICLPPGDSSPSDEWWEYVVRHQLFHAIQFTYANVRGSLGATLERGWTNGEPPWDDWVLEGTADGAVKSDAVMRRTAGVDPIFVRELRRADVSLTKARTEDDGVDTQTYPYETQDFWVHLFRSTTASGVRRNFNLGRLASFFVQGASTESVAGYLADPTDLSFDDLGLEYWAWAKNQVAEKTDLTFDDALQNPCRIEENLVEVARDFAYPEADQVFDALPPLQSELIQIVFEDPANPEAGFDHVRVLAEGDQLKYKVYLVEDPDTDFYRLEPNCVEIEDGGESGRSFDHLSAGSVVYVLLSRIKHEEEVVEPPLYRVWIDRESIPDERETRLRAQ